MHSVSFLWEKLKIELLGADKYVYYTPKIQLV